jgi:hypothetical protein
MKSIKESSISNVITSINFKDDWSLRNIKEQLYNVLGEQPAVEAIYQKDAFLNEVTGKAQEIKKLKSIKVTFTDLDEKIKTVEYLLEV